MVTTSIFAQSYAPVGTTTMTPMSGKAEPGGASNSKLTKKYLLISAPARGVPELLRRVPEYGAHPAPLATRRASAPVAMRMSATTNAIARVSMRPPINRRHRSKSTRGRGPRIPENVANDLQASPFGKFELRGLLFRPPFAPTFS
jgi:hypothetical protein